MQKKQNESTLCSKGTEFSENVCKLKAISEKVNTRKGAGADADLYGTINEACCRFVLNPATVLGLEKSGLPGKAGVFRKSLDCVRNFL